MMRFEVILRRTTFGALGLFASALFLAGPAAAQRPERAALNITGYVIDAELDTETHHLAAKAVVTFTRAGKR